MNAPPSRWLSAKSAAAYIDISTRTLYAWAADGVLPRGAVVRIVRRKPAGRGRHTCTVRIDKVALDRWLEGRAR